MSPVRALVVMLVVCALGSRAELDLRCEAFTEAMKDVAGVLECYSDTAQESLQINRVNSNSLQSLSDTVHQLKKEISLENKKNIELMKQEIEDLIKVGIYQQENLELKAQLERKNKEVEQLTQANAEQKIKLTANEKRVEQLTTANEELATKLADNGKQMSTVTNENHDLRSQLEAKDKKVRDLNTRLQESELLVQQQRSTVMKLNQTCKMEEVDQDTECRQPQLQKIQDVVQRFNDHKNLSELREDLESALDSSSEEYWQLQSLQLDDPFTFWVGHSGHTQLATLLLCAGLPVETADHDGDNMLHGAAWGGQVKMVKFLLDHGAQVDARGEGQSTPLMWAAEQGHLEAVKVLVEAGASTTARDNQGRTALEAARFNSRTAVVQYLQPLPH